MSQTCVQERTRANWETGLVNDGLVAPVSAMRPTPRGRALSQYETLLKKKVGCFDTCVRATWRSVLRPTVRAEELGVGACLPCYGENTWHAPCRPALLSESKHAEVFSDLRSSHRCHPLARQART